MDRIREALDRARVERARVGEPVRIGRSHTPWASDSTVPPPGTGQGVTPAPGVFVYTRTRIFTPSAEVLETNRIVNPSANSPASAAFRLLRTQVLQRMDAQGWRTLAIFGASANEGKTTTAINLAASLANDHSHSVLLVDFDLRHPSLASRLQLSPEFGVDDALTGAVPVEDCLYHPEGMERLVILPARRSLTNTSAILAGPRCRDLVNELRTRYPDRIVLFDLPPVLQADDALAFAPFVECGLVVTAEGRTRRSDLMRTMELLHKTPLVGTVLNYASAAPSTY